ncbi:MAG: NigD-like protein [Mediterranea sp.]|jgi:hypothetical protein|nr:NigD-like protein [Mediterranea sp.]
MGKFKLILGVCVLAAVSALQSCNDDDGYSIGDFSWDWATVRTTGSGGYYLEGDTWGTIEPVATSIPWYKPVDGERVSAFFNPLADMTSQKGVQVKMEGIEKLLTKKVEVVANREDSLKFGNDPITIYQGDMWLGGKFLNVVFLQNLPRNEKHLISLVQDKRTDEGGQVAPPATGTAEATPEPSPVIDQDGYVNLELRYNTYKDETNYQGWGKVSFSLEDVYPTVVTTADAPAFKGFKVTIHSRQNGEGVVVKLDLNHPAGVPDAAKEVHTPSSLE